MTDFILGFYVDRLDTKVDPHIVWAGFTEAERAAHKAWILKNLPQPPVYFHDTQAPIVITEPGRYLQADGKDFENFLADMGERPDGCTLDRINVNGNYEPSNCRWATRKEQAMNTRKASKLGDTIEIPEELLPC